jgi:phage-related protein
MAGPSIAVRVLGDIGGFAKSVAGAAEKGAGVFSKMHSGFSSMINSINQTGILGPFGQELANVNDAMGQLAEHGASVREKMAAIGGVMTGVGAALTAFGSKEKASHQQLQAAIAATGHSYDTYAKQIEEAIHHQENFGHSSEQTQDALRALTVATGSPAKALGLLNEASDLAASKHESLATAATQLGKVYNGNTKLLKEFGITVASTASVQKGLLTATSQAQAADTKLATAKLKLAQLEDLDHTRHKLTLAQQFQLQNAQLAVNDASTKAVAAHQKLTVAQDAARKASGAHGSAVDLLAGKLKGQASAAANTFSGHLDAMKTKIEDQISMFGQKYGPTLQIAGVAIMALASIMEIAGPLMAAAEALPLAPILLIVAAIGVLTLAAYEIYKHWGEIWGGMKRIIKDVWDWIKSNWPYLLGILLGPIALAVALIYKHWQTIKADAMAVISYIEGIWDDLVTFFTSIPAKLYAAASGAWEFIWREADAVLSYVVNIWNSMIRWVGGIPGAVLGAMSGLWGFISHEASVVYGGVVNIWNAMLRWVAGLPRSVARLVGNMWHGITDAFRAAINELIDIWDRLHFKIGGWHVGPVHVPTVNVGMPHIPHLAQGGLMTGSGLVYAHAGEVITPAPVAARRGPVVHVQNATFSTAMDVESFMKQVAWVAQTRGV